MQKRLIVLLSLSVLCFCLCKFANTTDLQLEPKTPAYKTVPQQRSISIFRSFAELQKKGNGIINRNIQLLKNEPDGRVLVWLLFFSLGYGMLHALGPGHGKDLVGFYFLHKKASPISAGKLALTIACVHTGMAFLLAVLFHTILHNIQGMKRIQIQNYFYFASGILIILVGAWLLYSRTKKEVMPIADEKGILAKNIYVVGISSGIVPCPLSLTIILITMNAGLFLIGLASITMISIGLAVVLFIIGILTIKSRQGILNRLENTSRPAIILAEVFSYAGAIMIILLGLFISFVHLP